MFLKVQSQGIQEIHHLWFQIALIWRHLGTQNQHRMPVIVNPQAALHDKLARLWKGYHMGSGTLRKTVSSQDS